MNSNFGWLKCYLLLVLAVFSSWKNIDASYLLVVLGMFFHFSSKRTLKLVSWNRWIRFTLSDAFQLTHTSRCCLYTYYTYLLSIQLSLLSVFFPCMKPQGQKTSEMLLLCIYINFLPSLRILFFLHKRFNCKNDLFGLVAATIISNNKFPKLYKSSKHIDKLIV